MHVVAGCGPLPRPPYSPGSNVIILSTPAPVLVGEAIHLHVLVWGHCRHSTKILWVRQPGRVTSPMHSLEIYVSELCIYTEARTRTHTHTHTLLLPVSEFVHGHRQVRGELFVAGVGVVVVLGQKVNIMQEDATPVFVSEGLSHPDVKQLGSVKSTIPPLKPEREAKGSTY